MMKKNDDGWKLSIIIYSLKKKIISHQYFQSYHLLSIPIHLVKNTTHINYDWTTNQHQEEEWGYF